MQQLVERVVSLGRPLLLAFDVDGTLAPIVPDPAAAHVPMPTRKALATLARTRGVRVAYVTGRDARSLRRVIHTPGVFRVTDHGKHIVAPGERARWPRLTKEDRARLGAFRRFAESILVPEGALLEDKGRALAVHVRSLAERAPRRAEAVLLRARAAAEAEGLRVRDGRAVCEAELESGDKGDALRTLARRTRARGVLYAGDDLTDLPALRAAVDLGGVALFVRSKERPRAPWGVTATLPHVEATGAFVVALAERLARN